MVALDGIAQEIIGRSVIDYVYYKEKKQESEPFDRVAYTYPAIFMVEYSLAKVLLEKGIEPDYVLGASMGEFASAALADVMKVDELFKILLKQAEALETYCEKGGMLAIIDHKTIFNEVSLIRDNSELVSVNYDSHFVISGGREQLSEIERYLKSRNILYHSLPVTYGFHSSYIDPAALAFKKNLQQKSYQTPRTPFISCLLGTYLESISGDYLWDVVRMPIQFSKAIRELENDRDYIYLDVGPGGTLANFARRNLPRDSKSECYAIMTLFNQDLQNLKKIEDFFSSKNF